MSRMSVALSPSLSAAGRPAAYRVESPAGLVIEPDQLAGRAFLLWYEGPKTAALNDEAKARLIAVLHALPQGRMRLRYGLAKDQSNLLFVDEAGMVRYRATGKVPEADLEQVAGLIRGAL